MKLTLDAHDALLVVDMQNDFLPGGSLGIVGADSIISCVNSYISLFATARLPIFISRDYHPASHISFTCRGGPWPPHCVAGTWGAEFHPDLRLPKKIQIISKATEQDKDAYSALDNTPLVRQLNEIGVRRVFICGLALDYCVLFSGRDLMKAKYLVVLLIDGVKAVNIQPEDGERARAELYKLGAAEITRGDLIL